MNRWYVAQTHVRSELRALTHLTRQGFATYMPQYLKRRRHARRSETVHRPLFPGYLFVLMDIESIGWRAIRSTVGVRNLICNGDRPLAVPRGVVEDIRAREDESGVVAVNEPPPFKKGETVQVVMGSANRDPRSYEDPDEFKLDRSKIHHHSFGFGIHTCIGAPLARLEARMAMLALVSRFSSLSRATGENERVPSHLLRGFNHLWLSFAE